MDGERNHGRELERISFGPFTLSVSERALSREGAPVSIGSRSLDLLIALARRPGEVVAKEDLINQVWDGLTVAEGALRVHVNGLRTALQDGKDGARYIVNVPGRGYSMVAPLEQQAAPVVEAVAKRAADLPPGLPKLVGRDNEIQSLVIQIPNLRFVSLVGPGGIGKTSVATAAVHQLRDEFDGNVHFINLSAVSDPSVALLTIASRLGVGSGVGDPLPELLDFLGRSRRLLILDSCEHLIEPVAALADAIRLHAPLSSLLTTTREPLRVEGEHVIRLPSLACPPAGAQLTAAESLAYPAVQLFVERVSANVADFALTDADAVIAGDICRKLDGMALALELCAGRVEAYGLPGMAELLERRLGLLWRGQRNAPPRHQTLQATLDWSYDLLEPAERSVFARLGIFAGTFTLKAAEVVAADEAIDESEVLEIVAGLVAKSLVSPVLGSHPMRYRLLDTSRTYSLEKLAESGDHSRVAKRHAELIVAELNNGQKANLDTPEWFMELLNDLRSALEWCFHKGGYADVGVSLVAAAATLLLEHALCDECFRWTQLAIDNLPLLQRGTPLELELQTSMGWSAMFAAGKGETVRGAFERGLAIAQSDPDPDPHQQIRLLNGLSFVLSRECDHIGGLEYAEKAAEAARRTSDASVIELADWTLGVSHHLCGHQSLVLEYCDSALKPPGKSPYASKIADYGYDYRGRALVARARALWLLGFPNEAAAAARFAIGEVDELSHSISTFVVLVYAATVFIWCNEWKAAEETIARLRQHAGTQALVYREIGAALEAMMNCRRGPRREDITALRESLERLVEERHLILVPMCRTTLAEALLIANRPEEALAVIDAAVDEPGPQVDGPEILRVKGAVMGALGDKLAAEDYLRRAVNLARQQSALAWELRATLSLARLSAEGSLAALASVYARFGQGHSIDDLKASKAILDAAGVVR